MNATNLVRHYDALTPWERLPLIAAAEGRGDEVEGQRLIRSAPRLHFGIADCWGLVQGLDHLAKHYLLVQLDRAALHWRVMSILDQEPAATRRSEERAERLWRAVETLAYQYVVHADGWKLFCRQLEVDPDLPLRTLPGHEAVCHMEKLARDLACPAEEAQARLQGAFQAGTESLEPGAFCLDTAEDVARSMRKSLEDLWSAWR